MFKQDQQAVLFGATPVENSFIADYLPGAKGDYIKVYLWGLYHSMHPEEPVTLQDMAAKLEIPEPEILKAFRYWERRGLVTMEQTDPPLYSYKSALTPILNGNPDLGVDDNYVDFAESVYAAFGTRRKVKSDEVARAWEWVQDIGLSPEAVLMLLNHCIAMWRPQFSFRKAEALAVSMKESGVVTAEDAEGFLRDDLKTHQEVREVLRTLGKRGRLESDVEMSLYRKWRFEWQFSPEAILAACSETAKGEPTFAYLDGILRGLRERSDAREGVRVRQALEAENEEGLLAAGITRGFRPSLSKSVSVNLYRQWRKRFPHEVLALAAEECRRTGKGAEEMEQLLTSWEKKGLSSREAAEKYLQSFRAANADLKELFAACDYPGRPTAADRQWLEEMHERGFTREQLLSAAPKARHAQGNKLTYLAKVLENPSGPPPAAGRTEKQVHAQQYTQRTYTEKDLSRASEELIREAMEDEDE